MGKPEEVTALPREPRPEGLAAQYAEAADKEGSDTKREAAMLFSVAESHLADEAADEVLITIKDAITIFRDAGDLRGLADCLRLQAKGWILKAEQEHDAGKGRSEEKLLLDAEKAARDELRSFKAREEKYGEASMLFSLAIILKAIGRHRNLLEAHECLQDAQDIAKELKDAKLEASAVMERALVLHRRHRFKQSSSAAREAQKMFAKLGDIENEAFAWTTLGTSEINNGRVEDGFVSKRKALSIYRKLGNRNKEATTLLSIAEWYISEREEYALGVKAATEARAIWKELGADKKVLEAYTIIIDGYSRMRDNKKAIASAREALEMARSKGQTEDIFNTTGALMTVLSRGGEYDEATQLAEELNRAAADLDMRYTGRAKSILSHVYEDQEEYERAQELAEEAVEYFKGIPRYETEWYDKVRMMGVIAVKLDSYRDGQMCMERCRTIAQKIDDVNLEAAALLGISANHYGQDTMEKAHTSAQMARERYQEEGYVRGECRVLRLALADYYLEEDPPNFPQATKCVNEAVQLCLEAGDNKMLCQMKHHMAHILMQEGKQKEGLSVAMEGLKVARAEEDKRSIACLLTTILVAHYQMLGDTPEDERQGKTFRSNLEKMGRYAKEALGLAVKVRDDELEATANLWVGRMHHLSGRFREALQCAEASADMARSIDEAMIEIDARILMGILYEGLEEPQQAVESLQVALQTATEHGCETAMEQASSLLEQLLDNPKNSTFTSPMLKDDTQVVRKDRSGRAHFRPPDYGRVKQFIVCLVQQMTGSSDPIDADVPLLETGVDSLASVELRTQLQSEFQLNLISGVLHEYPTIGALSKLLVEECTKKKIEWRC